MKEAATIKFFAGSCQWYRLNKINGAYNSQYLSILHETI